MEPIEAAILVRNLVSRVSALEDGTKHLPGLITAAELEALQIALSHIQGRPPQPAAELPNVSPELVVEAKASTPDAVRPLIALDCVSLTLPATRLDCRVCLDFGTAMSKATVVSESGDREEIHVLELGIPGDQEEISERMLISSVYIDNEGYLWFGKAAIDHSLVEGADGSRQRLDNIKRRLSEDGLEETVPPIFNPSGLEMTFEDVVLAYLMYLTWAANRTLDGKYPNNVNRRFALPCFTDEKGREVAGRLRKLLGEAQVLADTFRNKLPKGLPLADFMVAKQMVRAKHPSYPFILEDVSEPLGVAGSLLSWRKRSDMLALVVDVGAGTSDFSLYRIIVDPDTGANDAREVQRSARAITEAGNHLDSLLVELILKKANVTSTHARSMSIRSKLELQKRYYKETLFNEHSLYVPLVPDADDVQIDLQEFLDLDAVKKFETCLRDTARDILSSVDHSLLGWVTAHPQRHLTVVLTGGGAKLPMVKSLAEGTIDVHGTKVIVRASLPFPIWLKEEYPELEEDYAQIAVSLGGARKRIISRGAPIQITAGDVVEPARIGGYYSKGV